MSGWAGVWRAGFGRRPRLAFWLTFFQSSMLLLFYSGLPSYLVGIKRRTSRHVTCKKVNSHFLRYVNLTSKVYLLVNFFFSFWVTLLQSYMLLLFFSGLLSYLVGIKMRTSRRVACKSETTLTFSGMYLSPLKPKSCPYCLR